MSTWILLVALLAPAVTAPGSQPANEEREQLVGTLSAYHAALQAHEPHRVAALLGPSLFMADERSSAEPGRISPHMFLAGAELRAWPEAFLSQAGPYRNDFRVESISVRGDAAVVVTSDTGSNRFRSWREEEVVWFLGRGSGQWRIAGLIIRDIQLPAE